MTHQEVAQSVSTMIDMLELIDEQAPHAGQDAFQQADDDALIQRILSALHAFKQRHERAAKRTARQ